MKEFLKRCNQVLLQQGQLTQVKAVVNHSTNTLLMWKRVLLNICKREQHIIIGKNVGLIPSFGNDVNLTCS